jgi:hypothetical protein
MVRGSSVEGVLNDGQESRSKEIQERSKGGIHQSQLFATKGERRAGGAAKQRGGRERERDTADPNSRVTDNSAWRRRLFTQPPTPRCPCAYTTLDSDMHAIR